MQVTEQELIMLLRIAEDSLCFGEGGFSVFAYTKQCRTELVTSVLRRQTAVISTVPTPDTPHPTPTPAPTPTPEGGKW